MHLINYCGLTSCLMFIKYTCTFLCDYGNCSEKLHVYEYMYLYVFLVSVASTCIHVCIKSLICFEAWAKLAQQWLVCAPLGIHLEPTVNAVSDNIIIINCATGPKRELCSAK